MSLSVYPNRIPLFPTHRNLLDDVDAGHINNIQREVMSLAQSVGTNPHIYNDINLPNVLGSVNTADEGGIDADTAFSTTTRYYDPKVTPVDHGSVAQRLDNIERGKQNHVFKLRASNIDIASKAIALSERPRGIRFPVPTTLRDPFSMHDGAGVVLRKSGFWVFNASVVYTLQGSTAAANAGTYQAVIDHDQNWLEGMDRVTIDTNIAPILNPTLAGFFPRGTRIMLRTSHSATANQRIRLATLSGLLIREE